MASDVRLLYKMMFGAFVFPLLAMFVFVIAVTSKNVSFVTRSHLDFMRDTFLIGWGVIALSVPLFVMGYLFFGGLIVFIEFLWAFSRISSGYGLLKADQAITGTEQFGLFAVSAQK